MNVQPLLDAINDRNIVSGLTHDLYRYPARFSPLFARAAIELFTDPGETILDPFMGGSTSLVEALALGRHAVGTDINQLSVFLARVKTLLLSDADLESLRAWADLTVPDLSPRKPVIRHTQWMEMGYQTNMPWRFRKVAEQALNNAMGLLEGDLLLAARCIVLKTVQWAVDCKKALPTAAEFRAKITEDTEIVADGLQALGRQVNSLKTRPTTVEIHNCASDAISSVRSNLLRRRRPKLVVTSPPYPGVHVLYHRWQVLGRRETAAPYWITESNDGQGDFVLHLLRPPPSGPRREILRPSPGLLHGGPQGGPGRLRRRPTRRLRPARRAAPALSGGDAGFRIRGVRFREVRPPPASGGFLAGGAESKVVHPAPRGRQGLRTTFPWVFWGFHGKYKIFI